MSRRRFARGCLRLAPLLALLLAACVPRDMLLPAVGVAPPALRDFPADFEAPLSAETNRPMPGFGGGGGGLRHTPVLFVHGNTESARFWLPARAALLDAGWSADELWAFGFGWESPRWFDSNDLTAPSIQRMVDAMTTYLSRRSGREVRQIDIVAHSLGVTAVRQWMLQNNTWHRVRSLVAVAGANHGAWTARPDAHGRNRAAALELAPGSPWLAQLNHGSETPGAVRYLALYDGSGRADVHFPDDLADSPRLDGAENRAWNRAHDSLLDHLELARAPATLEAIASFLRGAAEPLPQAEPPTILRSGDALSASSGELACSADAQYPTNATPRAAQWRIPAGALLTCFAHDPRSHLSSPMQRFAAAAAAASGEPLQLRAEPAGGRHSDPQTVKLLASDPQAWIVYTTGGAEPGEGSPRYAQPVYVAAPLRLRAQAYTADGRRSEPLNLYFDISLEKLEQEHSLQRQFEPELPLPDRAERRKGH